ncbi:hypothetical protein PRZ48_003773 [Zasmidium cellare]|uniref:Uncharacterized protein n=1 Tax=Zasmidium cellare TaxID=395010 RepID=A0ABR0EY80_ZASCE|nr:hypothetical protein PRZ48_003773 [Zasmidium cellare]
MSDQRPIRMGGMRFTNTSSNSTTSNGTRANTRPPFDPSSIPYPTNHEITKSYGGHNYFMLSYNLKMYDEEDFEYSKQILEEIKRQVYEDRVETAKEEYEKGG